MALLKRIGWYLVGLSIGLVFLVFFLKKKSDETGVEFCYFPNCRVLKDIRSKPLTFSETVRAEIKTKNLDSITIANFLKDGDVDFSNSDTETKPCKSYRITNEIKNTPFAIVVKNCKDIAIIEKIERE